MSQNKLLKEIVEWNFEQCKESLWDILPQLISLLEEEESLEIILECLQIICNLFLPCLSINDADTSLFKKLIPKISDLFQNIITDIKGIIQDEESRCDKKENITYFLQAICQLLYNVLICIQFLNKETSIILEYVYSIPENIISFLKRVYSHCKESEIFYGDYLDSICEPLGNIFKLTYSIQGEYLLLLEKIIPHLTVEKDVQIVIKCCEDLNHLAQLVSDIDAKIMINIWKTYIKLITQWKEFINDRIDLTKTISFLCNKITCGVNELPTLSSEPQEFSKALKICNFNLKLIISICDAFPGYLGDGLVSVVQLILFLYRLIIPFFCGLNVEEQADEVYRGIVVGIEPLITTLLSDRQFIHSVLTEEPLQEFKFSSCMLKLFILQKFPTLSEEIQELWIKSSNKNHSLLLTMFTTIEKCFIEFHLPVFLPGNLCNGKSQKMVGFYEFVCIRLCSFISSMPVQYFSVLEGLIFNYLMASSGIFATLICDILCFIARYGSAELCFSYCNILADFLKSSNSENKIKVFNVKYVLQRMVKFLIPKYKLIFLEKFPLTENLQIWCHLSLNVFLKDGMTMSINELLNIQLEKLQQFYKEEVTPEKYLNICDLLEFIKNILSEYNDQVTEQQIAIVMNWWKILSLEQISSSIVVKNLTVKLTQISIYLIPHLQDKQLLKILDYLDQAWNTECDIVCAVIIQFLKSCKNKYISPSSEQLQIFTTIAKLFKSGLQLPTLVLQYECLKAFAEFAHKTPHENIIPLCIGDDKHLQKLVQHFLTKKAVGNILDQKGIATVLETQLKNLNNKFADDNDNAMKNKAVCCEIKEMKNILITIEDNVERLEHFRKKENLPEEIIMKLKLINTKICQLSE